MYSPYVKITVFSIFLAIAITSCVTFAVLGAYGYVSIVVSLFGSWMFLALSIGVFIDFRKWIKTQL